MACMEIHRGTTSPIPCELFLQICLVNPGPDQLKILTLTQTFSISTKLRSRWLNSWDDERSNKWLASCGRARISWNIDHNIWQRQTVVCIDCSLLLYYVYWGTVHIYLHLSWQCWSPQLSVNGCARTSQT